MLLSKLPFNLIPRFFPDYSYINIISSIFDINKKTYDELLDNSLFKLNRLFYLSDARTGIYAILKTLPPGEIIIPAYICQVVPSIVKLSNHCPVFVDINDQLSLSIEKIRSKITKKTRAIIAAHIFGFPVNIIDLFELTRAFNLLLVEDAAAAFGGSIQGKPLGKFGDASIFSFGKGKPLWINKGGLLLINNRKMEDDIIRALANFKKASPFFSTFTALINKILYHPHIFPWVYKIQMDRMGGDFWEDGMSHGNRIDFYQMDNFTKRLLRTQHVRWQSKIERRRQIARAYREKIKNPQLRHIEVSADRVPAWPCYPLLVSQRKRFFYYMQKRGIDLSWSWNYSSAEIYGQNDCPNASYIAQNILSLPTHRAMHNRDVEYIIRIANEFS